MPTNRKSWLTLQHGLAAGLLVLVAVAAVQSWQLAGLRDDIDVLTAAATTAPPPATPSASVTPATSPSDPVPQDDVARSALPLAPLGALPGLGWTPFQELHSMREQMDRLFAEAFGRFDAAPVLGGLPRDLVSAPRLDLSEEDGAYVIVMDVPGADEAAIEVTVEDQVLTVVARREASDETRSEEDGVTRLRHERMVGRFQRSVRLPGPVQVAAMTTGYEDGVLTVRLPKADAAA